ncbi:WD40 repeat domain-containing protein [Candidatus Poribacteria bacterium]|nr:WD40 repeat domain-containing protein [Candidatus Poribacteria bacterium]
MKKANKRTDFTLWELPHDAITRFGQGFLNDLAVSNDGTHLAIGSWTGVWLYDITTHAPVALMETERGMVTRIALCSTQPWLALKNTDRYGKELIKVWDLQKSQCIAVMEYPERLKDNPSPNNLCSLCFSPSGQWLAASRDRSAVVDIWESETGKLYTELQTASEETKSRCFDGKNLYFHDLSGALAFSLDNNFIAFSPNSPLITVWNITTCEHIVNLTADPEGIYSIDFSPCGQFLAVGGMNGLVQIWNTSTWQRQYTYPPFGKYLINVSYTPDGILQAAGISYNTSTLTIWDVAQPKEAYTYQENSSYDEEIFPIHFSNGTHLAFKSNFEVKVKSTLDTDTPILLPWELGDLNSLTFSPDGMTLAAGYRQFGGVILWDVATLRPQRVVTEPSCHIVNVYSDATTGNFYAAGFPPGKSDYWGNTLNLWKIGQSEPICELTIPGDLPHRHAMAYSATTNLLACGNGTVAEDWDEVDPENGAVYVWNVARGHMQHVFRGKHVNSINYVKFSPDGTRMISRDTDWVVRLWDVISGDEIGEFPENIVVQDELSFELYETLCERFDEVTSFRPHVFSLSGNLIAGRFSDDRILVWDIEKCEPYASIRLPLTEGKGNIPSIDPIELSHCGRFLAYGENWEPGVERAPVRLWDISTGENIATFLGHPTDIQCLAFSPDSTILASGGFDGVVYLWDLKPYIIS